MALHCLLECLILTFFLSTCLPVIHAQEESTAQPEVTIPQGTLLGSIMETRYGRSVFAFQGIPYGQPPIGNLRFANPVAADGWDGILNATDDSRECPQMMGGQFSGSEDCLQVNVYTPQLPEDTNPTLLPVLVFIHGGAFKGGSKDLSRLSPAYIMDKDLLLVALNYRVGPIGFLSTGDEFASGNWGLKDQVLALQWVQDNIQYFGGDPDQVTVMGESAGAGSVHLLTLADATIGLFHQYITDSGSALGTWAHRPRAAYASRAFELGEYVGCTNDTSEALISCLQSLDVENIVNSQSVFAVWNQLPDIVWGPTDEPDIEGALLTDTPTNLFAAGKIRDLPWMVGVVRDEGLILTTALHTNENNLAYFLENIDYLLPIMLSYQYQPDAGAAWATAAKEFYVHDIAGDSSEILANLTMLVGDSHFYWSTRNAVEQQHALATNPQYYFTFNYRGTYSTTGTLGGGTTNYGVAHGDELFYLFPHDTVFASLNQNMSDTDYEMVETMVELFTSFVIDGKPTTVALDGVTWNPYSPEEDMYLRIGDESDVTPEVQYSFYKERMQFWANLYATVETDASTELLADASTEALVMEPSGSVTWSSNFIFTLLVACLKFVF